MNHSLVESTGSVHSATSSSSTHTTDSVRKGRKGDERMYKALCARLDDPSLSLFDALQIGGFDYASDRDPNSVDKDMVTLAQRKNQLSRRIRLARKQQKKDALKSATEKLDDASGKPLLLRSRLSAGAREHMQNLMKHSSQTIEKLTHIVSMENGEPGEPGTIRNVPLRGRVDRGSSLLVVRKANSYFLPSTTNPIKQTDGAFEGPRKPPAPVHTTTTNEPLQQEQAEVFSFADRPTTRTGTSTTTTVMLNPPSLSFASMGARDRLLDVAVPGTEKCTTKNNNPFVEMARDILNPRFSVTPLVRKASAAATAPAASTSTTSMVAPSRTVKEELPPPFASSPAPPRSSTGSSPHHPAGPPPRSAGCFPTGTTAGVLLSDHPPPSLFLESHHFFAPPAAPVDEEEDDTTRMKTILSPDFWFEDETPPASSTTEDDDGNELFLDTAGLILFQEEDASSFLADKGIFDDTFPPRNDDARPEPFFFS